MRKRETMNCILASGSARRAEILTKNGVIFRVVKPDVKEDVYDGLTPEQSVMYLAFKKAIAVAPDFPEQTILAADTIVYKDEMIGKPRDVSDAERILKKLRNTVHEVLTGVAVFRPDIGKKYMLCDRTLVYFKNYSDTCIQEYIRTEYIWDKAGGYALQGAAGELFVDQVCGDKDNVIGLPWYRVAELL